jgi:hypothetical protein
MLEFILRAFGNLLSFDQWLSGGRLAESLADEQRERRHDARWSKAFLEQKRLEREESRGFGRSTTRSARSAQPITLGRPGSRRKP